MDEMLFWGVDIVEALKKYFSNDNGSPAMGDYERELYKLGQKNVISFLEILLAQRDGEHFTVHIKGLEMFEEMDIDELSKRFEDMYEDWHNVR